MEVKKGLRVSIVLLTLTYAAKIWTWEESQRSRIQAGEMSHLRGACATIRWNEESNEWEYERFGMAGNELWSCRKGET